MTIVIQFQELVLPRDQSAAFEKSVRDRLIELHGDENEVIGAYNSPDRRNNPASRFNRHFEQAVYDTMRAADMPIFHRNRLKLTFRYEKG